jgi:hypothetical protein
MLVVQPKGRIVERIIRTESGDFVRAYFAVAEYQGRLFVKLIRVEGCKFEDVNKEKKAVFLPGVSAAADSAAPMGAVQPVLSPYFFRTFFTSQMPRAPSV